MSMQQIHDYMLIVMYYRNLHFNILFLCDSCMYIEKIPI